MTIFHVAISYAGPSKPAKEIQDSFPAGAGWARYAANTWMVSTPESAEKIAKKIREIVSEKDSIFVVEVNLKNNFGYLNQEIWSWINKQNFR